MSFDLAVKPNNIVDLQKHFVDFSFTTNFLEQTIPCGSLDLPVANLGTLGLKNDALIHMLCNAIEKGYILLDTAKAYGNEEEIGQVLKKFSLLEKALIITKLYNPNCVSLAALRAGVFDSREKLGKVPELTLIHGPYPNAHMLELLKELEKLKSEGNIREWGVSNFNLDQLKFLVDNGYRPVLNQVEYHPFYQQPELVKYCQENDIVLQAYRPLAKGKIFEDATIGEIAAKHNITNAEVVYAWLAQQNIPITTRVSSDEHQNIFAKTGQVRLTEEEMEAMAGLHVADRKGMSCTRGGWLMDFSNEIADVWKSSMQSLEKDRYYLAYEHLEAEKRTIITLYKFFKNGLKVKVRAAEVEECKNVCDDANWDIKKYLNLNITSDQTAFNVDLLGSENRSEALLGSKLIVNVSSCSGEIDISGSSVKEREIYKKTMKLHKYTRHSSKFLNVDVSHLFKKVIKEPSLDQQQMVDKIFDLVMASPPLQKAVPTCHPDEHTMEESLIPYIDMKIHDLIKEGGYEQIVVVGKYDRSAQVASNEKKKKFNYQRPTAEIKGDILYIYVFPGMEYVKHYAALIESFFAINGQRKDIVRYIEPSADDCLQALANSNFHKIPNGEVAILGYGLEDLIGEEEIQWEGDEEGAYGWVQKQIYNKVVSYIGVKHSYWGDIAGKIVNLLAKKGYQQIIYVGKVGGLQEEHVPNKTLATGSLSYLNGEYIECNDLFDFAEGDDQVAIATGVQYTIPSVLNETKFWREMQKQYAFVDSEIGFMAKAALAEKIAFAYLHLISDNLNRGYKQDLSNEWTEEVQVNRKQSLKKAKGLIETAIAKM